MADLNALQAQTLRAEVARLVRMFGTVAVFDAVLDADGGKLAPRW